MSDDRRDLPTTWDVVLFRSATDADFRQSLVRDPEGVLRSLGLLASNETVILHEWKPNERVLVLLPLVDVSPERILKLRSELRQQRSAAPPPAVEGQRREPYSKTPPSAPIIGPATSSALTAMADRSPRTS
jgi:hypothetical protein